MESFSSVSEIGEQNSIFSASDQIINFGFGRSISNRINIGFNINYFNSSYESYQASAITSNISSTYHNSENGVHSTLLFKNIGRPVSAYTSDNEKFPLKFNLDFQKT